MVSLAPSVAPTPSGYTKHWSPDNPPPNPGGKRPHPIPGKSKYLAFLDEHAQEMIQQIYFLALNGTKEDQVRLSAAIAFLDRAYGKPTQEVRATLEDKRPIVVDASLGSIAAVAAQTRINEQQDVVAQAVAQVLQGAQEAPSEAQQSDSTTEHTKESE
jgi:hypothetical protein